MRFAHFFVDHPIFAAVLSIVLLLVGGIAYLRLPVAQYPEVAPPTIVVRASYPGANAQTVAETVATPLEQEINGVEDMLYMSSYSTGDGNMSLTITFRLGTDLDKAQVLTQNRVAIATPRLPEEVRRLGITTRKSSNSVGIIRPITERSIIVAAVPVWVRSNFWMPFFRPPNSKLKPRMSSRLPRIEPVIDPCPPRITIATISIECMKRNDSGFTAL